MGKSYVRARRTGAIVARLAHDVTAIYIAVIYAGLEDKESVLHWQEALILADKDE